MLILIAFFSVGSLLAGVARNMGMLIAARGKNIAVTFADGSSVDGSS